MVFALARNFNVLNGYISILKQEDGLIFFFYFYYYYFLEQKGSLRGFFHPKLEKEKKETIFAHEKLFKQKKRMEKITGEAKVLARNKFSRKSIISYYIYCIFIKLKNVFPLYGKKVN